MGLKLYLNKFLKVDNIESYTFSELMTLKKEYEKNSEAINKNNEIDIQIRNNDVFIQNKRNTRETNASEIARNEANIKNHKKQVEDRREVIKKLNEDYNKVKWENEAREKAERLRLEYFNNQLIKIVGADNFL